MPTICLNMIVKNESNIITRLFDSVLPIIDTYCICDTGSTDNTPQIITDYFNDKGIEGKVVYKEFVNFGENRTFAAQCAYDMADYLLLLDADMTIKISPSFDKDKLTKKVYEIKQGNDNFSYNNVRIVHTSLKPIYVGVTHEYIDVYANDEIGTLDYIFIHDIGDGGCKNDKFERDARLLEKGLLEEPQNEVRYTFYLANTYKDLGKYESAIEMYNRRIDLGEWDEEIFISMYNKGICYKQLGDESNFVNTMIKAWEYRNTRIESLYELIKYYCDNNRYQLAKMFYNTAKNITLPNDRLFVSTHMYGESLCNLHTLFSYYCGDIVNTYKSFKSMFNGNMYSYDYCMQNYKFYRPLLKREKTIDLSCTHNIMLDDIMIEYYGSSPSMIKDLNDNYIVNVRLVNYKIDNNGGYIFKDVVSTRNKCVIMDKDFNTLSEKILLDNRVQDSPSHWNHNLHGIEDIKLYEQNGEVYFTGTGLHSDKDIGCLYGKYDYSGDNLLNAIEMKRITKCEKNWIPITNSNLEGDEQKFIYKWYPLTISKLADNCLEVVKSIDMPKIFENARGSCPGYSYNGEIWYVVHYVAFENELRTYYHGIVILDKDLNLKRYSMPFKFYEHRIEYCLGIIVEDDRVLFSHSENDGISEISIVSKTEIESLLS